MKPHPESWALWICSLPKSSLSNFPVYRPRFVEIRGNESNGAQQWSTTYKRKKKND